MRADSTINVDEFHVSRQLPIEGKLVQPYFLDHQSDVLVSFFTWSARQDKDSLDPTGFESALLSLRFWDHPLNYRHADG